MYTLGLQITIEDIRLGEGQLLFVLAELLLELVVVSEMYLEGCEVQIISVREFCSIKSVTDVRIVCQMPVDSVASSYKASAEDEPHGPELYRHIPGTKTEYLIP